MLVNKTVKGLKWLFSEKLSNIYIDESLITLHGITTNDKPSIFAMTIILVKRFIWLYFSK